MALQFVPSFGVRERFFPFGPFTRQNKAKIQSSRRHSCSFAVCESPLKRESYLSEPADGRTKMNKSTVRLELASSY